VDLNFNARRTIKFDFAGSQILVTITGEENLWDSHNLLCLATAGGPIVLATIAGAWITGLFGAVVGFAGMGTIVAFGADVGTLVFDSVKDALFNSGDRAKPQPINLTAAIPGTDCLPTIQEASFAIEDGALMLVWHDNFLDISSGGDGVP
jgi:hypothetical protein